MMASKRKLDDEQPPINPSDFHKLLSSAVSTYESAEAAVCEAECDCGSFISYI
jgi:hypothetical protein